MLKRPHSFNEIKGHPFINEFFINHIQNGTMPQNILISGEEGLGKTSFADVLAVSLIYGMDDSDEKSKAIKDVIDNNKSNDSIKKYKMSVDGGKDAAKEVIAEFNLSLTPYGKKVLVLDECHGMSEQAQDVFLQDTEYLPKGLYIIMLTTETHKLKPTLQSRCFPMPVKRLKMADMVALLNQEVAEKKLNIQGGNATLTLLANWAECKPRKAMNMLDGFSANSAVSSSTIKEFIGYMEVSDILPLIESLSGSMTFGLTFISEMDISDSILDILIEVLKIKQGQASYKLQFDEMRKVKVAVANVPTESLVRMAYTLAKSGKITRQTVIASYMSAHMSAERLSNINPEQVLKEELIQKSEEVPRVIEKHQPASPSFESLLLEGKVVKQR